jgi:hypothetical protein
LFHEIISDPAEQKNIFKIGGSLNMDSISLGKCSFYMQMIFKKCPFKENGKLSELFYLVLRGLNLPAGSDTPQNKILRAIRPAEQWQSCAHFIADACSAGYQTPQNNVLRGLILCLSKFCGVSDPAEQSSAGYKTPGNNF